MVLGNVPQRLEGVEDGGDLGAALLGLAAEVGGEAAGEFSCSGAWDRADGRQELALRQPPRRGGRMGRGVASQG